MLSTLLGFNQCLTSLANSSGHSVYLWYSLIFSHGSWSLSKSLILEISTSFWSASWLNLTNPLSTQKPVGCLLRAGLIVTFLALLQAKNQTEVQSLCNINYFTMRRNFTFLNASSTVFMCVCLSLVKISSSIFCCNLVPPLYPCLLYSSHNAWVLVSSVSGLLLLPCVCIRHSYCWKYSPTTTYCLLSGNGLFILLSSV